MMLSTPRRRLFSAALSVITVLVGVSLLASPHEDTPRAAAQPICIPNPYVSCPPPPGQQPGDPGLPPITGGPPIPTPPLITPFAPTNAPGPQVGANSAPPLPPYNGTPIVPVPGEEPGPNPPALPPSGSGGGEQPGIAPTRVPAREDDDAQKCAEAGGDFVTGIGCDLTGMGPTEIEVCASDPYACARTARDGSNTKAIDEANKYFPGPTLAENRKDAARHCIWSGLMTESANAGFAKKFADAHEQDNPLNVSDQPGLTPENIEAQQELSRKMDDWNNTTGRIVGERNEGDQAAIIATCVKLANEAPVKTGQDLLDLGTSDGSSLVIQRDIP